MGKKRRNLTNVEYENLRDALAGALLSDDDDLDFNVDDFLIGMGINPKEIIYIDIVVLQDAATVLYREIKRIDDEYLTDDDVEELEKEVRVKLAEEHFKGIDVRAELVGCPKCDFTDLLVFQCSTRIWEVWTKCVDCGEIFCLGTE